MSFLALGVGLLPWPDTLLSGIAPTERLVLRSPAGNVEVRFPTLTQGHRLTGPELEVGFDGKRPLALELGLHLSQGNLFENAIVKEWHTSSSNVTYTTPFGRCNPVRDHFSQLTLDLQSGAEPTRLSFGWVSFRESRGLQAVELPTCGPGQSMSSPGDVRGL